MHPALHNRSQGTADKNNPWQNKIDIELIPIDCTAKFTFSIEKLRKEMLKNERGKAFKSCDTGINKVCKPYTKAGIIVFYTYIPVLKLNKEKHQFIHVPYKGFILKNKSERMITRLLKKAELFK